MKIHRFSSSFATILQKFWQIALPGWTPPITPVDPKSAQNPVNPEYLRAKKEQNSEVIELIYEYMLELVECEFAGKDPTN